MLDFPVVLFSSDYWAGLFDWFRERLLPEGMISPDDLEHLVVSDDPAEAVATVVSSYKSRSSAGSPATPAKADAQ